MTTHSASISIRTFLKPYLLPHKLIILLFLVTVFLATIETGLDAFFYKWVIDTVTATPPAQLLTAIILPAVCYVGMSLYHNLNMRAYHWGMMVFYPKLKQQVMQDLFTYATKHSVSFFQNNLAGDIAAKINDVTDTIEPLLRNVFEIFIARIFQPLVVAVFLSYVSIQFSFIFIVWTTAFVWLTLRLSKKIGIASHQYNQEKNQLSGRLIDVIGNMITTKIFGRIQFESQSIHTNLTKVQHSEINQHRSVLQLHFIQGILSLIILASFVGLLIYYRSLEQVTVGDFVFVLSLLVANLAHVYKLGEGIGEFSMTQAKFKQAINLLMIPHDVKDKPHAKPLAVTNGSIEFKQIAFHYIEDKPIFSSFNVSIQAGEKVGIVGTSGAGKSTFVHLLLRLIEPNQGHIKIDGIDINEVTLNSLRNQVTLVPQQIDLFHRSILDNIRYGNLEATDEEIVQAAKLAECDDFIHQLPDGYHTMVGERGMKLSGGQKQRIAIARAYLKPAKILILDEATSALDSITESYIQRALTKIMQHKTTIIIAHRLATLKQVDRVLVFENGNIVQQGKLQDLIHQPGKFAELWKQQYFMDTE